MRRIPWPEYSAAYWICIVGAFAFLIADLFSDNWWMNAVTIVLIGIAVLVRPGGIRGPGHARSEPQP